MWKNCAREIIALTESQDKQATKLLMSMPIWRRKSRSGTVIVMLSLRRGESVDFGDAGTKL